MNLPQRVQKSPTKYIEYIYDATGRKLRQVAVEEDQTKTTDYTGEFIYENDVLQFINHEEGRVIMAGTSPEYQYHLKDHLGNVRVTFTTRSETEETTATVEEENADEEQAHFLRHDKIRKVRASYFDHTNNNNPGSTNGYAVRLNGGENERFGLARSISVMPGDKITAEVYAKYVDATSTDPNFTALLANIAGQIAAGNTASGLVVDGGSFSNSTASFPFPVENGATKTNHPDNGVGPKAYLNWLVFDRDYNFILSKSNFRRLSATPKERGTDVAHERLYSPEITIDQAGYVYIYLSNEEDQPLEVYFDDFRVEHEKSSVVQMDDYYPFGLTFNSYKRENSVANKHLYQGKESQTELGLDTYDFHWRMYDKQLGRTWQMDPYSGMFPGLSPYSWAANNPISFIPIRVTGFRHSDASM